MLKRKDRSANAENDQQPKTSKESAEKSSPSKEKRPSIDESEDAEEKVAEEVCKSLRQQKGPFIATYALSLTFHVAT